MGSYRSVVALVSLVLIRSEILGLPTQPKVVNGHVEIVRDTSWLQVNAQGKTVIQWDQFDIALQESVKFCQKDTASAILNRVQGGSASQILGRLEANCPIYLVNPAGIFIGTNAVIQTAGFIASTANILDIDTLRFEDLGPGAIIHCGTISLSQGDVTLVARSINNQGVISGAGQVVLATSELMLEPETKRPVFIRLDSQNGCISKTQSPYEYAIRHKGEIVQASNGRIYLVSKEKGIQVNGNLIAEGGQVHVLGKKVDLEPNAYINVSANRGGEVLILSKETCTVAHGAAIYADGWADDGGKVVVLSEGITDFSGHVNARAFDFSGSGGYCEISGIQGLRVDDHPDLTSKAGPSGTLLLDPGSVLIQDGANIAPPVSLNVFNDAWIANQLTLGSVTILTTNSTDGSAETLTINGNVNITWATANDLTLTATRNVVINSGAIISCTASGNLSITGQGAIAGASYIGLSIAGGTLSTTTGNLTLFGRGGDTAANNAGISISGAPTIATTSGILTITGLGGLASNGISKTGGSVTTSGGGALNMTGTAGAGGTGIGISLSGGTVTTTNNGNITLTGTGAGTGAGSHGLSTTTNITAGGSGSLTITGTASGAAASSSGISVTGGITSTNSGLLNLVGQGGGTGDNNTGIFCTSTINTTTGDMSINALGTTGSGNTCSGISMTAGTIGPQGPGNLIINSAIGSSGSGASGSHAGIRFLNGGNITTVNGSINITATGATLATGNTNKGIALEGTVGAMRIESTNGGPINIQATGAPFGGNTNYGIYLFNDNAGASEFRRIQTAGAIYITALGAGSTGGSGNIGIYIANTGTINSTGSTVDIDAIGGGLGSNCMGISLTGSLLATISSAGTMTINSIGSFDSLIGGGHFGISFNNGGSITTTTGAINIIATGATLATGNTNKGIALEGSFNAMSIESTNGGPINIQATGAPFGGNTNYGIYLFNDNAGASEFRRIQTAGAIDITALGAGSNGGSGNIGIYIANTGTINSTGSTVDIDTIGGGLGNNCMGISLTGSLAAIASVGAITINSIGSSDSLLGGGHVGISCNSGGSITTTTGPINIIATGATLATGNTNKGIALEGSFNAMSIESTNGGPINIQATGAPFGGNTNYGIYLFNNDVGTPSEFRLIQTAGAVDVTAIGTNNTGGTGNVGLLVTNIGTIRSTGFASTSTVNILASTGGGQGCQLTGLGEISSVGGNLSLTATSSSTAGTSNQGLFMNSSSCFIRSADGIINIQGTGGLSSPGIHVAAGTINTTGIGNVICNGAAGSGTGARGILINGVSSLVQTTNGSIALTGTGNGTGTNASGIAVQSAGRVLAGTGTITLNGTASLTGTTGNSGILVTGTSSVITSVSGNINITATGNGSGSNNTGLSVTSSGLISTTSGNIQTTAPHSTGGAGTTNCYGIFVDGANSRITTASGIINLTGTGNGTGATNQGIRVSSAGGITTTAGGNITLTGIGSVAGSSSSEGIFITGASSMVSCTNGQIQISGTAGGGTVNGITIDSSGTIVTNTTGNINISSLNRLVVQNNSTLNTLGVGGPGINNINIMTNGITVAGGSFGRGLISTVNGNIQAFSTNTLLLTGSTTSNSFAQITVGNPANTIDLNTVGITMIGGSGSGAFAEISTLGGTLSLDGTTFSAGAISLTGGSNANTPAQIITKTTARTTANDMILIGQTPGNFHPTSITLQGGSGGAGSLTRAIIATDQGGNILCTTTGNHTITGGTGAVDSRSGLYTGFSSGSGNIDLTTGSNLSLTGGTGSLSNAEINAQGTLTVDTGNADCLLQGGSNNYSLAQLTSTGNASLSGANYTLTGGSSGVAGGSNAQIQTTGPNASLNIIASGDINMNSGSASDQHSYIRSSSGIGSNPIDITCANLFINNPTTVGDTGIEAMKGDVMITCVQDCICSASLLNPTARTVMRTLGSDLTMTANNIRLFGHAYVTTPDPGHLLLRAGVDIELASSSVVRAFGNTNSSLTLVVDNNFLSPGIGPGQLIIQLGATVLAGGLKAPVRIYTATFPQNTVNALLINGAPVTFGQEFVDTAIQQWGVYYPGGTFGGYPFKFYYKNDGVPPSPPVVPNNPLLDRYFESVASNLVQLQDLLPILNSPCHYHGFPGYHFAECVKDEGCEPSFDPYGSFIFEDDVYWTDRLQPPVAAKKE